MTCLLFILNLGIGNGGFAVGAPVDDALTSVNKSLFIEANKHLVNGLVATLVKSKAFPFPVAGGAHLFKLFNDSAAVLLFPFPGAL